MGIYDGLDKIVQYTKDVDERRAAAQENKVNFFKMDDGESVRVRFLQELSRDGSHYSDGRGVGIMVTEHSDPDNYRLKFVCSMDDEGQCVGCERHALDWKAGWRAKPRLYIAVLVERSSGEREIAVMSQPNGSKATLAPMIIQSAIDGDTICDRWWKITRRGKTASDTQYIPMPAAPTDDVKLDDYNDEIPDLMKAIRVLTYEQQQERLAPVAASETKAVSDDGFSAQSWTTETEQSVW